MRSISGGHESECAVGTEEGACLAPRRRRTGNERSVTLAGYLRALRHCAGAALFSRRNAPLPALPTAAFCSGRSGQIPPRQEGLSLTISFHAAPISCLRAPPSPSLTPNPARFSSHLPRPGNAAYLCVFDYPLLSPWNASSQSQGFACIVHYRILVPKMSLNI